MINATYTEENKTEMKSNAKEFNLRPVGTKHNLRYTVKFDNSWSNIKINNIRKNC